MLKFIILLLLSYNFLCASIIKNIEYIEIKNKKTTIKELKQSKEFKKASLPFNKQSTNDFFIKINLDKTKMRNEIKIVEFINTIGKLEVEKKINLLNEKENSKIYHLNKQNFFETIYVKIKNEDDEVDFDINITNIEDFINNYSFINELYSFAYGIIFTAFLYYFALYLFNRDKSYIYYSLTQVSILFILIVTTNDFLEENSFLEIFLFLCFFIFSNLFTKSFLNTKKLSPKSDLFLNIVLAVYILDAFVKLIFKYDFFSNYLPFTSLLLVYILAAINVYIKGYKPAIYYLFAWGIVVFSLVAIEFDFFINPSHILHITIPLESLILAFALSYKMKLLEEEKIQQQEFLAHQSKLASMGEMIGNIAHQWRQPLAHLSYIMMNLKAAFKKDKLSPEFFEQRSKEANIQLEFMSQTINDFMDFFKVKKEKEIFCLNEIINEVINLLNASFKAHEIEVIFKYEENIELYNLKGELLQVLFNILNNAKDELIRKRIKDPYIKITLYKKENKIFISILDNAGGIKEELLEKIFEPYFTTKDKGLGLGLYMSKMIIEKNINAKLYAKNTQNGLCFNIEI